MRFIFSLDCIDFYLKMKDNYLTEVKESIIYCEANSYSEAEEKAHAYFWEQHKSDKEYVYQTCFDAFCDSNFNTADLVSFFGEKDGSVLRYLHLKYNRESLYQCDIYYFETEDKRKLDTEDKKMFENMSEDTYKILHNIYISEMLDIVKLQGYNYTKYIKLAEAANHI